MPHFRVKAAKRDLLREALRSSGLKDDHDFHLLDSETTLYKSKGERVFVRDEEGRIDEVPKHSETISAFRDKPEAEPLLVVLASDKTDRIRRIAHEGQFIGIAKASIRECTRLELDFERIPPSREEKERDVPVPKPLTA